MVWLLSLSGQKRNHLLCAYRPKPPPAWQALGVSPRSARRFCSFFMTVSIADGDIQRTVKFVTPATTGLDVDQPRARRQDHAPHRAQLARVGWDTGAVLVGIGELLLPAPHRDFAGASFRAAARFLRPPLSSRTARFPRSGWKRRHVLVEPSRLRPRFKRWRAYAACDSVCSSSRPIGVLPVLRAQSPSRLFLTEPPSPRAPSLHRRYPASPLLRAHAPIPAPPLSLSVIALWEMSSPLAPSTAGRGDHPALGLPFFPGVLRPLRRRFVECT